MYDRHFQTAAGGGGGGFATVGGVSVAGAAGVASDAVGGGIAGDEVDAVGGACD